MYKEMIFMNNDIKFLNMEWRTPYPLTNFENRFGLRASVIISPVSEGSGDVMVLRQSRPPPAARNGVNAITQKPRDGLFSNLVYTLVVIVSLPD